ncbi:SprT family zinc-dependent metalloprotease [Comamonadaceae bacterium G21597-S1]|nr:SprT family zinc-dependent metalloprotease [Comamonadaceae bacterium G21597-S1]
MRALLQYTLDLFAPDDGPEPAPVATGAQPSTLHAVAIFRHPRANREVRLCGSLVGYEFKRGKRRTIGFSVGADGLVVHAPKWVTVSDVQQALDEKASWIVRKLVEARDRQARMHANRIEWRDGAQFPFLGNPMRIVLDSSHAGSGAGAIAGAQDAALGPDVVSDLRLGLPHHATEQQIRDSVQAWLMRQARRVFSERLDHYAPRLQVQWRKLSLSSAGTRWGSARADGSIRLHWRLIHFRMDVIDYVVAHELSHLRVMDHSPRFWDTVRSVMPDYQALRGQLKDESIPLWN